MMEEQRVSSEKYNNFQQPEFSFMTVDLVDQPRLEKTPRKADKLPCIVLVPETQVLNVVKQSS